MSNNEFGAAERDGRVKVSALTRSAMLQAIHFITAALVSSSSSQEFFSPLGVAFCAGTKKENTLFSCLGAMLGYIVSNEYLSAFRYVMALIIVYILKAYINSFDSLRDKRILPPVIAAFSAASTGAVAMASEGFDLRRIFVYIAETAASFGAAYFFTASFSSAERLKRKERLADRELTALVISCMTVLLSMTRISVFGISPSGAVCSYIVMAAAYIFNESGGAIIGTGASLGFALAGIGTPTAFCYGAAGLFSGLFSYSGRILSAMAYIFSYGAMFLALGGDGEHPAQPAEAAIASLAFILTPPSLFAGVKELLGRDGAQGDGEAVKNTLVSRLKLVREAVGGVSGTVSKVSEILKEKAAPDTAGVYLRVRDGVCSGCGIYEKCWKSEFPATAAEFDAVIEEIRKNGTVTPSFAPQSLQNRCIRIMSLCDSFNKNYSSYSARVGAEGRINEMRKITVDQFESVCDMIDDLLTDIEDGAKPVAACRSDLENALSNIGVNTSVSCCENGGGKMLISFAVPADCSATLEEVAECAEKAAEKEFDSPVTVEGESETAVMLWEKPLYSAECTYCQMPGEEGEICGDCFDSFYDGRGNFIAVISDGMGTGGRAAIDGAMASSLFSRLIISGFSFPCALKLVNSALLVKSREESLATLDILKIDLYTGKSSLYKAGAAPSLMKRGEKVGEIQKSAMPIGILRQAEFAIVRGAVRSGDVIVMMSDGAADIALEEIKRFAGENEYTPDFAEKLCAVARSKSIGRCDDITVAAVKINKKL